MEIFYQYDIDLEDNDGLDLVDLLKKALILVKHKNYRVDFIRDKETDLVNKYTKPQEKVRRHTCFPNSWITMRRS